MASFIKRGTEWARTTVNFDAADFDSRELEIGVGVYELYPQRSSAFIILCRAMTGLDMNNLESAFSEEIDFSINPVEF